MNDCTLRKLVPRMLASSWTPIGGRKISCLQDRAALFALIIIGTILSKNCPRVLPRRGTSVGCWKIIGADDGCTLATLEDFHGRDLLGLKRSKV